MLSTTRKYFAQLPVVTRLRRTEEGSARIRSARISGRRSGALRALGCDPRDRQLSTAVQPRAWIPLRPGHRQSRDISILVTLLPTK